MTRLRDTDDGRMIAMTTETPWSTEGQRGPIHVRFCRECRQGTLRPDACGACGADVSDRPAILVRPTFTRAGDHPVPMAERVAAIYGTLTDLEDTR